jgi:hypothetical protein
VADDTPATLSSLLCGGDGCGEARNPYLRRHLQRRAASAPFPIPVSFPLLDLDASSARRVRQKGVRWRLDEGSISRPPAGAKQTTPKDRRRRAGLSCGGSAATRRGSFRLWCHAAPSNHGGDGARDPSPNPKVTLSTTIAFLRYGGVSSEQFAIVTQLSSWFRYFDNPNADFVIIGHQTWAPYYFDTIRTFNTSSPCICAVYDQNALPSGCWLLTGLLPLAARLLPQAAGLLSMAGQRLCMASQLYCFFL